MNFFKRLLGRRDEPATIREFWEWFRQHDHAFFNSIKGMDSHRINNRFLNRVVPRLQGLNERFYCETGMTDDDTAELVISAEGDIKTFVFVEDLVEAAPTLPRWKFTALKPPTGAGSRITMNGAKFDSDTIRFFYDEDAQYPDEIDLTMVHEDFGTDNQQTITYGCLLYLDTLLGELNAATLIDNVRVKGPQTGGKELIPMEKLNDFLQWKEKEFVEKYEGTRHNTENDEHFAIEGEDTDGFHSIATVNGDLLHWDAKASHPWMTVITIDYEKTNGLANNGMPNEKHYDDFNALQDDLDRELVDSAGYLNLGRETYKGKSKIFIACREFRKVSEVVNMVLQAWRPRLSCEYDIYKDKYWRTMSRFETAS